MTYEMHLRDERKQGIAEGMAKGKFENMIENVRSLMKSLNCDAARAMTLLNIPGDMQDKVLSQL